MRALQLRGRDGWRPRGGSEVRAEAPERPSPRVLTLGGGGGVEGGGGWELLGAGSRHILIVLRVDFLFAPMLWVSHVLTREK